MTSRYLRAAACSTRWSLLTERGASFSRLFLFYKESGFRPRAGSLRSQSGSSFHLYVSVSGGPPLRVSSSPQEPDLTLRTPLDGTVPFLLEREKGTCPTNWRTGNLSPLPVWISVHAGSVPSLHRSSGCVSVSCSVLSLIEFLNRTFRL